MTPEREFKIGACHIKEFYWAGDMVCYVNNQLSDKTFDTNVAWAKEAASNATQTETRGECGMPDITMCINERCKLRHDCYRFLATPPLMLLRSSLNTNDLCKTVAN